MSLLLCSQATSDDLRPHDVDPATTSGFIPFPILDQVVDLLLLDFVVPHFPFPFPSSIYSNSAVLGLLFVDFLFSQLSCID
jgi:hypothetical protein